MFSALPSAFWNFGIIDRPFSSFIPITENLRNFFYYGNHVYNKDKTRIFSISLSKICFSDLLSLLDGNNSFLQVNRKVLFDFLSISVQCMGLKPRSECS